MTSGTIEQEKDRLLKQWVELGLLVEWASNQSNQEMEALSDYIEEQAGDLINNFREISSQAKEQSNSVNAIVEHSTNIMIDDTAVPIVEVVESLDNLLSDMIGDIVDISKKAMTMVFVMQQVLDDSENIKGLLGRIFSITKNTKYLAINASIEAAAAGVFGKGFAVVANEVNTLSSETEDLANNMNTLITQFTSKLNEGFVLLEEIASKDLTEQMENKENIDKTLQALIKQAQKQNKTLRSAVDTSENISQSVSRLIMAMQFQDYAKQRMQHLSATSDSIVTELKQAMDETQDCEHFSDIDFSLSEDAVRNLLDKFSLSHIKNKFENSLDEDSQTSNLVTDNPPPQASDDDIFFDDPPSEDDMLFDTEDSNQSDDEDDVLFDPPNHTEDETVELFEENSSSEPLAEDKPVEVTTEDDSETFETEEEKDDTDEESKNKDPQNKTEEQEDLEDILF